MRSGRCRQLLLAGACLILGLFGTELLKSRLAQSGRYRLGPVVVDLGRLPPPLQGREAEILGSAPLVVRPASLFDPTLPDSVVRRLEARPWVRRVLSMRRRLPAGLHVHLEVRRPLAVVCAGGERLAVDAEAVVLEADTPLGPPAYPEIHTPGAPLVRVPHDGRPFWQPAVLEAVALLEELAAYGDHPALTSVVVQAVRVGKADRSRHPGASDLTLVLRGGTLVDWGRSPRAPLARVETPARRKLDNLALVLRKHPALLGIERVDLRPRDPLYYPKI